MWRFLVGLAFGAVALAVAEYAGLLWLVTRRAW